MSQLWRWRVPLALGPGLVVVGLMLGVWPSDSSGSRSRALVTERTWPRRGPRVLVAWDATTVRDRSGERWSVASVLSADGYRVRAFREYISRDALAGVEVLVLKDEPAALPDRRLRRLVERWLGDGGAVLVVTSGGDPGRDAALPGSGADRLRIVRASTWDGPTLAARVLAAMHDLTGVPEN